MGLKLPDNIEFLQTVNTSVGSKMECEQACLRKCSYMAYATYASKVSRCVVWFESLIDIREYRNGQDLHVRMAASEFESNENTKRKSVIVSTSVASGILLLLTLTCYYFAGKRVRNNSPAQQANNQHGIHPNPEEEDLDLPLFDWLTVSSATNDFAFTKKIDEGGFGPVYMGKLPTGQEIAVKRLSKDSGQGLNEFKNEAWKLWNEGRPMELIESLMDKQVPALEVLRCIQVGLLCVQQRPEDRQAYNVIGSVDVR
ncbi:hypothetical protein DITRI_Ditri19aG0025200 [Diplodiscus trichospermus]